MGDYLDTRMSRREARNYENICEKERIPTCRGSPKWNKERDEYSENKARVSVSIEEKDVSSNGEKAKQKTWPPKFKSRHLCCAFIGLILFISDLISDWRLVVIYFQDGEMNLFYLTLGFILGPSVLSGVISILWYAMEEYHQQTWPTCGTGNNNDPEHALTQCQNGDSVHPNEQKKSAQSINDIKYEPGYQENSKDFDSSEETAVQEYNRDKLIPDSDENSESKSLQDYCAGRAHCTPGNFDDNKDNDTANDTLMTTHGNDTIDGRHREETGNKNKKRLLFRILMSFLQLGRIYRSIEYVVYMIKSWRCHPSRKEHMRMKAIEQKQDAAILGLVDGFLESALQLVLQLYLTVSVPIIMDFSRVITLLLSLGSTAVTHTVYYRTNRKSKCYKNNVSYTSSLFYFLWKICELSPRFLLLALSIYCFFPWIFIAIFLHILGLSVCLCLQNPDLHGICPNNGLKTVFLILMSYVGLFCYVHFEEGKTRKAYLLFYLVFYVENIIMVAMIFWYSNLHIAVMDSKWTYSTLCLIPGLLLHILFQILYYKKFHPNKFQESITCFS